VCGFAPAVVEVQSTRTGAGPPLSAIRAGPRRFGTASNAVERPCRRQRARTAVATPASSGRRSARRLRAGSPETIGPPLDGTCLAPQPAARSATASTAITHKARTSRAYAAINRLERGKTTWLLRDHGCCGARGPGRMGNRISPDAPDSPLHETTRGVQTPASGVTSLARRRRSTGRRNVDSTRWSSRGNRSRGAG